MMTDENPEEQVVTQAKDEAEKIIEEAEREEKEEQEMKERVMKQIEAEAEEQGLRRNDIPQEFDPYGMMASTCDYTFKILKGIRNVLKDYNVNDASINRRLLSECQVEEGSNELIPMVYFTGEEVIIKFQVMPTDRFGNNGKQWLTNEEYALLKKRREMNEGGNNDS